MTCITSLITKSTIRSLRLTACALAFGAMPLVAAPQLIKADNGSSKESSHRDLATASSQTCRIFESFPVNPQMAGWQCQSQSNVTSLQGHEEFNRFSAEVTARYHDLDAKVWPIASYHREVLRQLRAHRIDISREAVVFLSCCMDDDQNISVAGASLENGILKISVSQQQTYTPSQRGSGLFRTVAVAVDPRVVKEVAFEHADGRIESTAIVSKSQLP